MKKIVLLSIFALCGINVFAQNGEVKGAQPSQVIFGGHQLDSTQQPLTVINGKPYSWKYLNSINPNLIEDVKILQRKEASIYGAQGANGAIVLKLKRGVKWISIAKIAKQQHVSVQDLKLPKLYQSKLLQVDSLLTDRDTKYTITVEDSGSFKLKNTNVKGKYLLINETMN